MKYMTTQECADHLKVHPNTLKRYVHEEGLPVLKFPGRRKWTFRSDLVDAWYFERSQPVIINDPKPEERRKDYGTLRILRP